MSEGSAFTAAAQFAGLRVGLVGPLPPPAGGMANQTRQLAELLRGEGAKVELVQTNAAYRPAVLGRVPVLRAVARLLPYLHTLWHAAGRCDLFHVMANSGWSWHLFAAPAIWVARLRGIPVIVNYRGGEAAVFLQRAAAVVRWSMQRAARLVVPSGFLEGIFDAHRMRAEVLPNIVDLARFHPPRERPAAAHLVVARNLEALYDNTTALRAFRLVRERCPQARLSIAGSGPEEQRLRVLANELGVADAVRFCGRLDREAMAALYRDADVMLNPSLADNMPNSVLEALASGVAVVTTNVGGIPYIVSDGATALLVAPRDPQSMAAAALRVLGDAALRSRLVDAGLREAERYTWGRIGPQLALLYRRTLTAAQPQPA